MMLIYCSQLCNIAPKYSAALDVVAKYPQPDTTYYHPLKLLVRSTSQTPSPSQEHPPLIPRLHLLLRTHSLRLPNPHQECKPPNPNQRRKHNVDPLNRPPLRRCQPSLHLQRLHNNPNQTHIHY